MTHPAGDLILSPKDERCPYWSIGAEVRDEADAISVTRALYPGHSNNPQTEWFESQATLISAYLLAYSEPGRRVPTLATGWLTRRRSTSG